LDDSSLKAHLQPYNHVCIREYVASLRGKDLEVFAGRKAMSNEGGKKRKRETKKAKKAKSKKKRDEIIDAGSVTRAYSESGSSVSSDARTVIQEHEAVEIGDEPVAGGGYDETLLAIIGVLDEVKEQSNVAGWIRAGGLWGPSDLRPPQYRYLLSSSAPTAEVNASGNDAAHSILSPDQNQNHDLSLSETASQVIWFDHEPTFVYWVRRGRKVLHELGIEVVHGIVG